MSLALTGLPSMWKVNPSITDDWCDSAATRARVTSGMVPGPSAAASKILSS